MRGGKANLDGRRPPYMTRPQQKKHRGLVSEVVGPTNLRQQSPRMFPKFCSGCVLAERKKPIVSESYFPRVPNSLEQSKYFVRIFLP